MSQAGYEDNACKSTMGCIKCGSKSNTLLGLNLWITPPNSMFITHRTV